MSQFDLTTFDWVPEAPRGYVRDLRITVADIAMADVLRLMNRFERLAGYPACREYLSRAVARPAFQKAHADQLAHFAAAD